VFVISHRVFRPGTSVWVEMELPDGTAAAVVIVRGAERIPETFTTLVRGGMGIEFAWVPEKVYQYSKDLYPALAKTG